MLEITYREMLLLACIYIANTRKLNRAIGERENVK